MLPAGIRQRVGPTRLLQPAAEVVELSAGGGDGERPRHMTTCCHMARVPTRQHVVQAGEAFDGLLHRVVALNRLFGAAGEALARPAGQTLARYLVLREAQNAPASVAELARRLRLTRQGVQRVADLLAGEGLVTYTDNPRHRRAKLVRPTDAGRAALEQIVDAQRAWAERLGPQIGHHKLEQANELLDEVLRVLEEN